MSGEVDIQPATASPTETDGRPSTRGQGANRLGLRPPPPPPPRDGPGAVTRGPKIYAGRGDRGSSARRVHQHRPRSQRVRELNQHDFGKVYTARMTDERKSVRSALAELLTIIGSIVTILAFLVQSGSQARHDAYRIFLSAAPNTPDAGSVWALIALAVVVAVIVPVIVVVFNLHQPERISPRLHLSLSFGIFSGEAGAFLWCSITGFDWHPFAWFPVYAFVLCHVAISIAVIITPKYRAARS